MNEQVHCPYCTGSKVTELDNWTAQSEKDEDNTALLTEWQCFDCDNRSFWL